RRLRIHGGFVNVANWAFRDASRNVEFGLHVYSAPATINFYHLSRLFNAGTLIDSFSHSGLGPPPAQRYGESWDLRPHKSRIVRVDDGVLRTWQLLTSDTSDTSDTQEPPGTARLLYPLTQEEQSAIEKMAGWKRRLNALNPEISRGYDESGARRAGLIY